VTHTLLERARSRALRISLALTMLLACGTLGCERAAAAVSPASWDSAQQRQALADGLMSENAGSFSGAADLSAAQANAAMAALASMLPSTSVQPTPPGAGEESTAPSQPSATSEPNPNGEPSAGEPGASGESTTTDEPHAPDQRSPSIAPAPPTGTPPPPLAHTAQNPVTVATFDRMLVEEFGLAAVAAHVQQTAVAVGLDPPSYFGTEVVARFLELDYEHPVGAQRLDLFPDQPITRAAAAWSLARVIDVTAWDVSDAREALTAFELPKMTAAQRQALRIAVSRIGYPYVWGGTTDNTADGLEHGGFDCSGFAWRVYKVSGLPWGKQIRGRTAAEQAGEIPRSQRLSIDQLATGDLLFFGSAHFNSKATESNIIHEGIYLGNNWVINSSGQGVYVLPLTGSWLGSSFAWGRRVIN
jgi:cell wall-associated NlpC family hydrolase